MRRDKDIWNINWYWKLEVFGQLWLIIEETFFLIFKENVLLRRLFYFWGNFHFLYYRACFGPAWLRLSRTSGAQVVWPTQMTIYDAYIQNACIPDADACVHDVYIHDGCIYVACIYDVESFGHRQTNTQINLFQD